MRLLWLPWSRRDLQSIRRYYTEVASKVVADRRVHTIVHAAERLLDHPFLGHPSERTQGVHELQVGGLPYLLPYRVVADRIEILRVFDESLPRPEKWSE
jgi:plasmid stabilization system protein ParE